jgi:hypothetical protein
VFSDAGGTGQSYHASTKVKNQRRRIHYLIQAGWVADAAIQGFGRTHRSDQSQPPLYKLVTTNLKGQRRFISSIARRLDQLGALTKGQRQASSQGIFKSTDNLESQYAKDALIALYEDLFHNRVEGITLGEFAKQTGLKLVGEEGELLDELPPVTRFLNRILSMQIAPQDKLFDAYATRIEAKVRKAEADGTLDIGTETVVADRVRKVSEQVVYVHPVSGAETKHVVLALSYRSRPTTFDELMTGGNDTGYRKVDFFARNTRSHQVWAFTECDDRTMPNGSIRPHYYQVGPVSRRPIPRDDLQLSDSQYTGTGSSRQYLGEKPHWEIIKIGEEARKLWDEQLAALPEFNEEELNLITGAVLPIWDRLRGNPKVKRLATDEGERLLGRVVPDDQVHDTLKALGVKTDNVAWTPELIIRRLRKGSHYFKLANGWKLKSAYITGEKKFELVGPDYRHFNDLKIDGIYYERIGTFLRFFVPVNRAEEVIGSLIKNRPVIDCQSVSDTPNGL